jgi:uncharacterized protein (TIGR00297 family)
LSLNDITLLTGFLAIIIFGLISFRLKLVDLSGLISGWLISFLLFAFGGWRWLVILLFFHFLSSAFTKYGYDYKRSIGAAQVKSGARSWKNVIANSLIATLMSIFEWTSTSDIFIAGFIGTISTSMADTLATEIGLLSSKKPRLITNLNKKVDAGTSGGITILGEIASFTGSILITFASYILGLGSWSLVKTLLISLLSGIIGSTTDSLLGARLQGIFRCEKCGKTTELHYHCDNKTTHLSGNQRIDNNIVNILSSLVGAIMGMLIYQFT